MANRSIYVKNLQWGKASLRGTRFAAQERTPIRLEEIWNDWNQIPLFIADKRLVHDGDNFEQIVVLRKQKRLTRELTNTRYYLNEADASLFHVIPASFSNELGNKSGSTAPTLDGLPATGYQPVIVDATNTRYPQDPSVWIVDGINAIVEFVGGRPPTLVDPLTITYMQYTGRVGGNLFDPNGGLENSFGGLKIKVNSLSGSSGVSLTADGLSVVDRVKTAGDTMSGDLDMAGRRVKNIPQFPVDTSDACSAAFVVQEDLNLRAQTLLCDGTQTATGHLNMGRHLVQEVLDPLALQDAATKNYVDARTDRVFVVARPFEGAQPFENASNMSFVLSLTEPKPIVLSYATGDSAPFWDPTTGTFTTPFNGVYAVTANLGVTPTNADSPLSVVYTSINGSEFTPSNANIVYHIFNLPIAPPSGHEIRLAGLVSLASADTLRLMAIGSGEWTFNRLSLLQIARISA